NCQARPYGLPRQEGRWMYRTDRTTGQKCWFLAGVRGTQRIEKAAVTAERSALTMPEETTVQSCVGTPSAPAARNTQWRYRIDRRTHQKCWHLYSLTANQVAAARTRKSPPDARKQSEQDRPRALRSVLEANASLLVADAAPQAGNAAINVSNDPSDDASIMTFESR